MDRKELVIVAVLIGTPLSPAAHAAEPALCGPLRQVIASGDFTSLQSGAAQAEKTAEGDLSTWAATVQLPGASRPAEISSFAGERSYSAEFGAWENLAMLNQPSYPDLAEMDKRFKGLVEDLITCLPEWTREKRSDFTYATQGPQHLIRVMARQDKQETWLTLQVNVAPAAAAKPMPKPNTAGAIVDGALHGSELDFLNAPPIEETFADNRRKWLAGSEPATYSARIEGGEYRLENSKALTLFTWIPVRMSAGSDFTLTVRFDPVPPTRVAVLWATRSKADYNALFLVYGGNLARGSAKPLKDTARVQFTAGESVAAKWLGADWADCGCGSASADTAVIQRRGDSVTLTVNGKPAGTLPYRAKGNLFGFAVQGTGEVRITRFALTTP